MSSYNKSISEFAKRIGIRFRHKKLLVQALTHSSYVNESQEEGAADNEGLEFLGDAVLGLIISHHLVARFPELAPGDLSRMKSVVVSRSLLGKKSKELGIGDCLRIGRGEELTGGRRRHSIVANALEAVIGAIFLDLGLEKAGDFVINLLADEVERYSQEEFGPDFKSLIQKYALEKHQSLPVYRIIGEKGPQHNKEFESELRIGEKVMGKGAGRSKKEAEQVAANQAWEKISKKKKRKRKPKEDTG